MVTLAVGIALLIVGVGGLGCLLPLLLGSQYALFGPLIKRIRGEQNILVHNFQVLDNRKGVPVDVILYRKPGGGNVRLGDLVRVHGKVQRRVTSSVPIRFRSMRAVAIAQTTRSTP